MSEYTIILHCQNCCHEWEEKIPRGEQVAGRQVECSNCGMEREVDQIYPGNIPSIISKGKPPPFVPNTPFHYGLLRR